MVIDILRKEHRSIETLLQVLEREFDLFAHGERPDYEVIHAVMAYFQVYPDACHHPLEDIVLEKLKVRDSAATTRIGDLAADHRRGAERLRRAAQAVESVLADRELLRQAVGDIIRDFIEQERRHMAKEERDFFPAAAKALQPQDWAEIAARLSDQRDPLFSDVVEEKFEVVRSHILQLEREAEAERSIRGRRESYSFVTKIINLFGDWLKQRRALNELKEFAIGPGELERVARELNVTPTDLEMPMRQGSQSANELSYMLTALGIDEARLWRAEPALLRDIDRAHEADYPLQAREIL
jgi:hemerythrin-like domain-containing protein